MTGPHGLAGAHGTHTSPPSTVGTSLPSPSLSPSTSSGASARAVDAASSARQSRAVNASGRQKFSRSKDGCLTCRKRRKRCDLTVPKCKACMRLHLTCSWPGNVFPSRPPVSQPQLSGHRPTPPAPLDSPLRSFNPGLQQWTPTSEPSTTLPLPVDSADLSTVPNLSGGTDSFASLPSVSPDVDLLPGMPFEDMLGLFDLDEATLQLWAADCMQPLTTSGAHAVGSNTVVNLGMASAPPSCSIGGSGSGGNGSTASMTMSPPPASTPSSSSQAYLVSLRGVPALSPTDMTPSTTLAHSDLLKHFQNTLSRLVSCSGDGRGFDAFTALADKNLALYLSILAWAGRHLANSGQPRYEAISERLGAQAGTMVLAQLEEVGREIRIQSQQLSPVGSVDEQQETDKDHMTLLAAALMVMQFRICRGDVWGFDVLTSQTAQLASALFNRVNTAHDPMAAQFFDNLIYHDILCSFAYTRGPMVPYSLVQKHTQQQMDLLHTLTGVNMPVFCKMYHLVSLIRDRRAANARGDVLSDEILVDIVRSAEKLEEELEDERQRIEMLIRAKPEMRSHRYLHEAFRTASLIQIRGFVLCEPPCSLKIRLLVRQSLSLLEVMTEQGLPGLCSIHWVLFITAVCAVPGLTDGVDDRERVEKLYKDFQREIVGFRNVPRSRRLVQEVWAHNQEGKVFFDWLDVVSGYDWEIFLV